MQDRYVGDLGDFGKYGLLRALCRPGERRRLGVAWYLTPDEDHNDDGRFTSYLEPQRLNWHRFRSLDSQLYDALRALVPERRRVSEVERAGVLPLGTRFWSTRLSYDGVSPQERAGRRESWLRGAIRAVENCSVVFLDPDNGIASERVHVGSRGALKYVFLDEVRRFSTGGRTTVVYHHLGRHQTAVAQIRSVAQRLEGALGVEIRALRFHRGSARAFFVATTDAKVIGDLDEFSGRWTMHFTSYGPSWSGEQS